VRTHVPARLQNAAVFGSTARAEAAPSSDVDVLLIFRRLPPDREPHASMAEDIAARLSQERGVAVEPWSVSLPDLRRGRRTPMLVDALADALPLWPVGLAIPRPPFTTDDARFCVRMLLARIGEGGREVAWLLRSGYHDAAARRMRDDLVRGCIAALLLRLDTRPRRAQAVRVFAASTKVPRGWQPVLAWAAASFGPEGSDDQREVAIPPFGLLAGARVVGALSHRIRRETLPPRAV
ncbi:MAG: nucleotidyltransferase domain-containing protein, partial [Gemmatimonadetes bacterium]|nr:nucleotidyltransferase domain-containing protein [Gemmatimonadota bacterium]